MFDGRASDKKMINNMMEKARKVFHWLVSFLNQNGWQHPNLRLVLYDVYVRSVLQFGCNIWCPKLLLTKEEHPLLRPVLA